jgi:GT2 family glycosyltransferase
MKGISIIIVCYKSEEHIQHLIESFIQFSDIAKNLLQFIIVDNWGFGKEDKIVRSLSQKYNSEFIYKKSGINGGYGAGNNIGFSIAKYDIVCVVNPDVRLISPIFNKAIRKFEDNLNLLGLSGEQQSRTRNSFFIRPEFQYPIFKELSSYALKYTGLFSHRYMAISGAMTFYRKSLFLKVGLFDERIFLYGEESDVSIRALKSGYDLEYYSQIKYQHLDWDLVKSSFENINNLISSVSYYQNKHKISCKGYFYAGILHFFIKYLLLLVKGKSNEANEAKDLIYLYKSKINKIDF